MPEVPLASPGRTPCKAHTPGHELRRSRGAVGPSFSSLNQNHLEGARPGFTPRPTPRFLVWISSLRVCQQLGCLTPGHRVLQSGLNPPTAPQHPSTLLPQGKGLRFPARRGQALPGQGDGPLVRDHSFGAHPRARTSAHVCCWPRAAAAGLEDPRFPPLPRGETVLRAVADICTN